MSYVKINREIDIDLSIYFLLYLHNLDIYIIYMKEEVENTIGSLTSINALAIKEVIIMADYAKCQLKALDRIAKKIADAEGHLTKIEDSVDNKKHRTAQHETIN